MLSAAATPILRARSTRDACAEVKTRMRIRRILVLADIVLAGCRSTPDAGRAAGQETVMPLPNCNSVEELKRRHGSIEILHYVEVPSARAAEGVENRARALGYRA